jgi:G6PDH family F420-dependent oxidoreductase
MTAYGFTLFSELNGPKEMIAQAEAAERVGFDFLGMSDHFHPWLSRHTDSPLAWSALGAVAAHTDRVGLVTLVTCPFLRYHPAIIAQGAATVALLSDGRFSLGLGAGENLSEHIVGRGWPAVDVRHEMLAESVEAIRALWSGEWVTYRGDHVTVEDARVWTLPDEAPAIGIAAAGPQATRLAAEHADFVICDEPNPDVASRFKQDRDAEALCQIPVAYDPDHEVALDAAHHFDFAAPTWKAMAEIPNVPGFDGVASLVRDEDITELVPTGSDPAQLIETIEGAVEAGYDRVSVVQVGPDRTEGFMRWWSEEVAPRLPS